MSASTILVIRPGALGDAIVALPMIQDLSVHHDVDLATSAAAANLLRGRCAARHVYDWNHARWAGLYQSTLSPSTQDMLSAYEALIVIMAPAHLDMAARLRQQLAMPVIGWPALPEEPLPVARHLQRALAALGVPASDAMPRLHLTDQDLTAAERFWQKQELGAARHVIALHPGSGSPRKNWPADRFAALSQQLMRQKLAERILLICGPADQKACDDLLADWTDTPPLLAQGMPLTLVGALLTRCQALVSNDSGIGHLAAALGMPTLTLFGPTDPRLWAPLGPRTHIIHAPKTSDPSASMASLGSAHVCHALHHVLSSSGDWSSHHRTP